MNVARRLSARSGTAAAPFVRLILAPSAAKLDRMPNQATEARTIAIETLRRDPLRNIVLLKHLEAFPDHTRVHHIAREAGSASLVLVETAASPYDRTTYSATAFAALVSSDHPCLTEALIEHVPRDVGIVFKLASEGDHDVVAAHFPLERTTSVLSFTATTGFAREPSVRLTAHPAQAVFDAFEAQGHARAWLEPLLQSGRAFACVLEEGGTPLSMCFAFENYRPVWEVGGVYTAPSSRGRGLAARVVKTAIAELAERGLTPRYQAHDDNAASIALAESIGLTRFLTITHFLSAARPHPT